VQSPSPFWVAWGGPLIANEIDFVFIDTEHTPLQRHDVSAMCMQYKGVGLPALVRVVDVEEARQALDGGAAGVVLPYVETVEQVRELHGAVKLRPLKGARMEAVIEGGGSLESYDGQAELQKYVQDGAAQRALVINVESVAAIANLDALLDPALGVDCVLIGPHDLSCSLGVPEQYGHPKFRQAVKTIFEKARAKGVGAAIHHIGELFGDGMQNRDAAEMVRHCGCNNLVTGGDLVFFVKGLQDGVRQIKALAGESNGEDDAAGAAGLSA